MRTGWRVEADQWTPDGVKITSEENLEVIRRTLDEQGPIVVEHRRYRGSSAPDRLIFDDYENFIDYLNTKAWAGDSIWIWSFDELCRDENSLVHGKCPDDSGCVPEGGAY